MIVNVYCEIIFKIILVIVFEKIGKLVIRYDMEVMFFFLDIVFCKMFLLRYW